MNVKITKLEGSKIKLEFVVEKEKFNAALDQAFKENSSKFKMPGFRNGKVPRNVIEKTYGENVLFEEAFGIVAENAYIEAVEENKLEVVSAPQLAKLEQMGKDKDTIFVIEVYTKPEAKLKKYKGLTIEKVNTEVTEDDVKAELESIRNKNARIVAKEDGAVENGDIANIDFEGFLDGVAFQGGKAEKYDLEIGSGAFIPGFEEQLVGMAIGETKDITVTFPEEYHAEELAGKEAVFTCTINGITVKELPTLDDDFAQDVSEFSTMEEYRADIARIIGERYTKDAENADESKLVETIVEAAQFELPEEMVEEQIDNYVEDFKYQLMYQGLDIDSYFKYTNSTMEDLRAQHKDRATKAVRTRLVFEEIVKAEKIKATAKQINEKIKEYAERNGSTYEDFNAQLRPEDRYYFENQVITEALLALLKKENTIA